MNFGNLENFINYKPIFDENPQYLIDEIITDAKSYLNEDSDFEGIQKAYEFARKAHKNSEARHSGEPYIIHPVLATKFLMMIKPGIVSIQACLLHDVIEDTPYTYEDIKNEFGEDVATICVGLEKVSKVKYKIDANNPTDKSKLIEAGETRQIETLKKTFLAMGKDLRVIFIKLADRIHNIQTLKFHPKEEKKQRIATETLKIFVPIAQRLGLSIFQSILENGSFKIINEKEFSKIFNHLTKKFSHGQGYIDTGRIKINEILTQENSIKNFVIKGRLKSPYRIYKKMKKYQTTDISKIMDVMAFRIITENISDCYNVLGIIHSHYTPIINKIKDYISLPKANGYRSIHTTVLGMFDFPVEIQIRTQDMDEIAEFGVAAHYAYKENGNSVEVSEKQAQWIRKLQEIVKEFQEESDKEKFKDQLQIEILDKNIFVYTPTGEVKELPNGSTVLDFAFRIHTDLGLKFKTAFVNNVIVPIDFKLKNGDIVNIVNYKNRYTFASSWLNFLHTPSAKAKLNKQLKITEKDVYIKEGIEALNNKLKQYNLPIIGSRSDLISKKYKGDDFDRFIISIYEKQITPMKVVRNFYENEVKIIEESKNEHQKHEEIEHKSIDTKSQKAFVIIDGDKQLNYIFCPECKPKLHDPIIGKSSKEGIKIHKISCTSLQSISYEKILEAHWSDQIQTNYVLSLEIDMLDKPGVLLKILTVFSNYNVNICNLNAGTNYENGYSRMTINLEFVNPSKIHFVLKELKNKENLVKIVSKKFIENSK